MKTPTDFGFSEKLSWKPMNLLLCNQLELGHATMSYTTIGKWLGKRKVWKGVESVNQQYVPTYVLYVMLSTPKQP